MRNNIFNFIKFGKNVDINSIEMFHACLEYNTKIQPKIRDELEKWPTYYSFWNQLTSNDLISPFSIISTIGNLKIAGDVIKSPVVNSNNNRVIFLLHGITNTRYWLFKQAYVFLTAGYNVVWYDARNHGQSDSAATTFGKNESSDLQDIINYINENYPDFENYILYGYSLGGASIIMWGALRNQFPQNEKVKAIICDSVFSRLEKNYSDKIEQHIYLPTNIMISLLRNQARRNVGPNALEILQPIKYIKYLKNLPSIFIHGHNDRFVSYTNSEELYREKICYEQPIISKLYLVENANHGQSFLVGDSYPEIFDEYEQEHKIPLSNLVLEYLSQWI